MTNLEQQLLDEGKRALTPTPAQRDALRARIDRAIAAPPPAPPMALSNVHLAGLLGLVLLGAWVAWPPEASERAAMATPEAPAIEPIPVVAPEPELTEVAPAEPEITEVAPPAPEITEVAPPEVRSTSAAPPPVDTLDAELRLLGEARRALARGQAREARESLEAHERSFPDGVLREEREALFVRAFCDAGEQAEARRRLAAFEREHPSSVALRALRETCESVGPTPE